MIVESIEELLALSTEAEYSSELPMEVAKKLLNSYEVPPKVAHELMLIGLAKRIGDMLHTARGQAGCVQEDQKTKNLRKEEDIRLLNKKVTAAISRHIRVLRDISLACDGRLKSLHSFTHNDIQNWISRSSRHANGWTRRSAWFREAEKAIIEHKKRAISELPDPVLKRLSAAAENAWSDAT